MLVSTHYMDEAEYCNRVALINQGRLIAIGSPGELKRTALGGDLLMLECDALGPTLAALQQAPGVLDVARCSAMRCMCWSRAPRASLDELPAYLARQELAAEAHRADPRRRSRTSSSS